MLYYTVKLINPSTKEVFYEATSPKPALPGERVFKRHPGALLVIDTHNGVPVVVEKTNSRHQDMSKK